MVLAHWSSNRRRYVRIRLPHDPPILPLPSQLGPVDLCLRALIHSNLQRATILLRHVLPLQRRRQTIRQPTRILEILVCTPTDMAELWINVVANM